MPIAAEDNTNNVDYQIENKQDVEIILDKANEGDQNAIDKLNEFKALKESEVNKVADDLTIDATENVKSIPFDDGSEIELQMYSPDSAVLSTAGEEGEDTGNAEYANGQCTVDWYYMYKVKVLGVEVARYTVEMQYGGTSSSNISIISKDHMESGMAPYSVTHESLTTYNSSGAYVQCCGKAKITQTFPGATSSYTVKMVCNGYYYTGNNRCTYTIS